jgi:hypothetical protein
MTYPAAGNRVCEGCLSPKPLTEFRLRNHGGIVRMARCRDCHNRAERERRSRIRRRDADRRLSHLLAKVQSERSNKRLVVLCNAMLDEFGGIRGFVESWRDFYRRSNGLDQMRCLKAVLSLVRVAESLR